MKMLQCRKLVLWTTSGMQFGTSTKLSGAALAELIRKQTLDAVYIPEFKGLSVDQQYAKISSGEVWWKHSNISNREYPLSSRTLDLLSDIDRKAPTLRTHTNLDDPQSPVWKAFRLVMTHHSTAIEGNKMSEPQVQVALDEYAEGLYVGLGISEKDVTNNILNKVHQCDTSPVDKNDVVEVVNHAKAMEYVREHMFGTPLTETKIINIHKILMPTEEGDDIFPLEMRGLPKDHVYRRIPLKVSGSCVIRPYPHELPAAMNKLFTIYEKNWKRILHPVIAAIVFVSHFLHIHPFHDGNGRTARLLLVPLLYNSGYFGTIIHHHDRGRYIKCFDPFFERNECDLLFDFHLECTLKFLEIISEYNSDTANNRFRRVKE